MKIVFFLQVIFILCCSSTLLAKTSLSLRPGTMEIGGAVKLPISISKEGQTKVGLLLAPAWNYFITRSFSLGLSPDLERDSLTTSDAAWKISISALLKYHFDLGGTLYPYIGTGAGIAFETKKKGVNFLLSAPVGMLVAINNRVAIDFGVPIGFTFNGDGFVSTLLPIGYLGVHAFL